MTKYIDRESYENYPCASEVYKQDDRKITRLLFEYCRLYAEKYYNTTITISKFIEFFMNSHLRFFMDIGFPKLFGQSAVDNFKLLVDTELDSDLTQLYDKEIGDDYGYYSDYELYWIGEMYVHVHFKTKKRMAEIYKIIPLETMREIYITGHQLTFAQTYERWKDLFEQIT